MQQLILSVGFAIFVVWSLPTYSYGESCTVNGDCTSTSCARDFHVICQHPNGSGVETNGGLCTCAVNNYNCTTREECLKLDYLTCISEGHKHCYDNKCICSRW